MGWRLACVLSGLMLLITSGAAWAHHSFAMFDDQNPVTLSGVVTNFKFSSPHSFILLQVKGEDGNTTTWNLEGVSPSALVRDGWTSKTLKPGDEIKATIVPLRSGVPGGAWDAKKINFLDGTPVVVHH